MNENKPFASYPSLVRFIIVLTRMKTSEQFFPVVMFICNALQGESDCWVRVNNDAIQMKATGQVDFLLWCRVCGY